MGRIERFEDLEAWKSARELVRSIYKATSGSAFSRDAGLRGQIQRASVSVMSNIAEGFERGGDKEFFQFLALAKGSCGEVRAQLYVALDQTYINDAQFQELVEKTLRINRLIAGLMKYLQ